MSMEAGVVGDNQRWVIIGVYGPSLGEGWANFLAELQ